MAISLEIAFGIDFNLAQVPAALGLPVTPVAAASMLGITDDDFTGYCESVTVEVTETARQMLADDQIAQAIAAWQLPGQARIVTLGDSNTTYRYSYAELLRALLTLARPADQISVLNVAQSGYTSSHAHEVTFTQILPLRPDWAFVMYGVNDSKQFGGTSARTLVSRREYAENMRAVVRALLAHNARVVLLTPTPTVESLTNTLPDFVAMQMTWDNRNIAACAHAIRKLARACGVPCVDAFALFGSDPDPALYLADGLHPNFKGQQMILREVLKAL